MLASQGTYRDHPQWLSIFQSYREFYREIPLHNGAFVTPTGSLSSLSHLRESFRDTLPVIARRDRS